MSWIRIDDDTYALEATPDPQEVVSIKELEAEIANLEVEILNLESTLIKTSSDYPEGVNTIIDASNNERNCVQICPLKSLLESKKILLTELQGL